MMEDFDLGTGLGAIALTVLILREVFSFVKSTKTPNGSAATYETSKTIGMLETEIRKMSHAINNLNQLLTMQTHLLKESRAENRDTLAEVRKLREEIRR
jgi:TolA-binding protein